MPKVGSAFRNSRFASASGTRSCGRRGPARLGSTVERSSSTSSEYVGCSVGSCQSMFSLQYASTSAPGAGAGGCGGDGWRGGEGRRGGARARADAGGGGWVGGGGEGARGRWGGGGGGRGGVGGRPGGGRPPRRRGPCGATGTMRRF